MSTALVISPDTAWSELLARSLGDAGWKTHQATDGPGGLDLARSVRPDLVICEIRLAGMNGFDVCRALRDAAWSPQPKRIILVCLSHYPIDGFSAAEAGADDFWVKPATREAIAQKLARPPEFNRLDRPIGGSPFAQARPTPPAAASHERIDHNTVVRFWGVRGSIPTPGPATVIHGGNTACVEIRVAGQTFILDAGTGLRPLGLALMHEAAGNGVDCDILLSHTHWDHIQGLPFFAPFNDPLSQIRLHGFATADQGLAETLRPLMQSPWFPIDWHQLPGRFELNQLQQPDFRIGEVQVRSAWLNHPGICAGFRLETPHGSVAYLPDHEPFHRYISSLRGNPDTEAASASLARRQDAQLRTFIEGCDILIADAQYDPRQYPEFAGWGHGCSTDTVRMALEAGVKQLCLFHHDPSHNDDDLARMTAEAQELARNEGSRLVVECAREGLEIVLG